jgi:hypothetical protein
MYDITSLILRALCSLLCVLRASRKLSHNVCSLPSCAPFLCPFPLLSICLFPSPTAHSQKGISHKQSKQPPTTCHPSIHPSKIPPNPEKSYTPPPHPSLHAQTQPNARTHKRNNKPPYHPNATKPNRTKSAHKNTTKQSQVRKINSKASPQTPILLASRRFLSSKVIL